MYTFRCICTIHWVSWVSFFPFCVFFLHLTTTTPLQQARVPWLRDRVPSQVTMAVMMADNCHRCLAPPSPNINPKITEHFPRKHVRF